MLCFKLLGDEAQSSFARSWGISYGVGAASEWKDIVTETAKAAGSRRWRWILHPAGHSGAALPHAPGVVG
jgi:hypothetical protein